jgi:hypothetical protein
MDLEHKQAILAHCLWMAKLDPDYAVWAAGWYERNEPALLKNLQAKVQQEVRRDAVSPQAPRAEGG